jgi:salicylate hydroxylase
MNAQIEDAVTLGRLFSRLSNRKQIPLLLNAYYEIRHPRTSATQESEYQSLVQISLPPGPYQEGRDAALKSTLNPAFEEFENCEESAMLVQTWEQYIILFSHDASEEVDSWWSMWGSVVDSLT